MGIDLGAVRKGYFGIPLARSDADPETFYGPFDTPQLAKEADDGGAKFWMVVYMEYKIEHIVGCVGPEHMEPDDE